MGHFLTGGWVNFRAARTSGERLAKRVTSLIDHYKNSGRICSHVIVITHSMGGLVTRAAVKVLDQQGAKDKVLGVIHGVQPVNGSPASYWRMKAGFERPEGITWKGKLATDVLGQTGRDVMAVLANIPGGFELLPSHTYRDNAGNPRWIQVVIEGTSIRFPAGGDVYEEIYKIDDKDDENYLRLVPDPAYLVGRRRNWTGRNLPRTVIKYNERVDAARSFHNKVGTESLVPAYVFWGNGMDTADTITFTGTQSDRGRFRAPWPVWKFGAGAFSLKITNASTVVTIRLENPNGDGDGTVSVSSGSALTNPQDDPSALPFAVAHEPAYQNRLVQEFVYEAIENMCEKKIKDRLGP